VLALATLEHLNTALGWLERARLELPVASAAILLGSGGSTDLLAPLNPVTIQPAQSESETAENNQSTAQLVNKEPAPARVPLPHRSGANTVCR